MDADDKKMYEAGRQLAPFLVTYVATQLACARPLHAAVDRQRTMLECVKDAQFLVAAVLDGTTRPA